MKIIIPMALLALLLASCSPASDDTPETTPAPTEEEASVAPVETDETSEDETQTLAENDEDTVSEDTAEVLSEEEAAAYEAEKTQATEAQAELEASLGDTEMPTLASGSFVGIAPGHNADGQVMIKENGEDVIIELSADFASDAGPDLYVVLTQAQEFTGADPVALDTSKIHKVSPLVSLTGTQSYTVSKADFEANNYAVAVWCNKFNVVFGGAVLK